MAMKQCANGHIYDDSKSADCPYCSGKSAIVTIPLGPQKYNDQTLIINPVPETKKRTNDFIPPTEEPITPNITDIKTEIKDPIKSKIPPVRGWLVVIEGENIGMDFRIHAGWNTILRSENKYGHSSKDCNNNICIDFDKNISREGSATILYDEENNIFVIACEHKGNAVYINGKPLIEPKQLEDNDIIKIGITKMVFRALCNDKWNYDNYYAN